MFGEIGEQARFVLQSYLVCSSFILHLLVLVTLILEESYGKGI